MAVEVAVGTTTRLRRLNQRLNRRRRDGAGAGPVGTRVDPETAAAAAPLVSAQQTRMQSFPSMMVVASPLPCLSPPV